MANPSKRTGTEGENRVADWLREIWPLADRGASKPGHDIVGIPLPVEVKRHKTIRLPEWTRYLQSLHGGVWALFVLERDRRRKDAHPDLMVVPAELGVRLLSVAAHYEPDLLRGENIL